MCDLTLVGWIWVAVDTSCRFGKQKHVEPEVNSWCMQEKHDLFFVNLLEKAQVSYGTGVNFLIHNRLVCCHSRRASRQCYCILFQSGTVLLKYFHDVPIQETSVPLRPIRKLCLISISRRRN